MKLTEEFPKHVAIGLIFTVCLVDGECKIGSTIFLDSSQPALTSDLGNKYKKRKDCPILRNKDDNDLKTLDDNGFLDWVCNFCDLQLFHLYSWLLLLPKAKPLLCKSQLLLG